MIRFRENLLDLDNDGITIPLRVADRFVMTRHRGLAWDGVGTGSINRPT